MNEQIGATPIGSDEAEALFSVEPLDGAFRHGAFFLRGPAPPAWDVLDKVLARPRRQGEQDSRGIAKDDPPGWQTL
jgi:hypothetical protein